MKVKDYDDISEIPDMKDENRLSLLPANETRQGNNKITMKSNVLRQLKEF